MCDLRDVQTDAADLEENTPMSFYEFPHVKVPSAFLSPA